MIRCVVWILAVCWACLAQDAAQQTGDGSEFLPFLLVPLVLVPALLYFIPRREIAMIRQQMMIPSAETGGDEEEDAANEIAARRRLEFAVHDADQKRENVVHPRLAQEKSIFRRVCLADLGIAAMYALLPLAFGGFQLEEAATLGLLMGAQLAIFSVMRYLLHQGQFQAFNLRRSRGRQKTYRWLGRIVYAIAIVVSLGSGATVLNLRYLPDILRVIFGARLRMVLSVLFFAGTIWYYFFGGLEHNTESFGLLLTALLHAIVFVWFVRRLRQIAGLRLLVLRVFSTEERALFLFSGVMQYWRHFGNHLTIVDQSLLQQERSNSSNRNFILGCILILLSCLCSMLIGLAIESRTQTKLSATENCFVAAVPILLLGWGAWKSRKARIERDFTRSLGQIQESLRHLEMYPRRLDLSFRSLQAMCHRNTWFPAVREFAQRTDAVLMDLRDYSAQRKGCEKEVNLLFDTVPLSGVLFLIDPATDRQALETMLSARWARLSRTSPNLDLSSPVCHLYEIRDDDERDMQAILDHLILVADTGVGQARTVLVG